MPRSKQDTMKRKKYRGRVVKKEAPLPVFTSETGLPTPVFYTGYLQGSFVVVQHSGDMEFLYKMGFFGKGNLSRSEPNFEGRQQRVNIPLKGPADQRDTIQPLVLSRRKYLAHLRYRALSDDDEPEYNNIVEQEQSQLSLFEEVEDMDEVDDFEDEEADEEEEEEEEEGEIGFPAIRNLQTLRNLTPEKLSDLTRSHLVAIMNQVAMLSKEGIATFQRVPYSMLFLENKFKAMKQKQVTFLESFAKGHNKSLSSSGGVSRHFKSGVDIKNGDSDPVVVLNIDASDNEEQDEEEKKDDGKENEGKDATAAKGWDDSDYEGDEDFWGAAEDKNGKETKEKTEEQGSDPLSAVDSLKEKESDSDKDDLNSEKCQTVTNAVSKQSDEIVGKNEENCADKNVHSNSEMADGENIDYLSNANGMEKEDSVSEVKGEIEKSKAELTNEGKDLCKETCVSKNTDSVEMKEKTDMVNDLDESVEVIGSQSGIEVIGSQSGIEVIGSQSGIEVIGSQSGIEAQKKKVDSDTILSSLQFLLPSSAAADDNDSSDDDVICVEEDSAQPAKLHQYLSQPSASQSNDVDGTKLPVVTKSVYFMSYVTTEPKFIDAKVGFRSWDHVLHFDYAGDQTHIPIAMHVIDSGGGPDGQAANTSSPTSSGNMVYERVYPPVNSLIAHPKSEGSVIKQRLRPIPFLDMALSNLQQILKSQNSVPTMSSHTTQLGQSTRPGPSYHPQQPYSRPSFPLNPDSQQAGFSTPWSQSCSLGSVSNIPKHSSHLSSAASRLKPQSIQSPASIPAVIPSDLKLYLDIFEEEKSVDTSGCGGEEGAEKEESKDKEIDGGQNLLKKLHVLLGKTGLLKQTSESREMKEKQNSELNEDENSPLLEFNKRLSEYLISKKISLEQELALLRVLMYDKSSVCVSSIPKEVIGEMKSKLSPGLVSCLLERLDYIQNDVEKQGQKKSDEVITIDLSDEENDGNKMESDNPNHRQEKKAITESAMDNVGGDGKHDSNKLQCHKAVSDDDDSVIETGKKRPQSSSTNDEAQEAFLFFHKKLKMMIDTTHEPMNNKSLGDKSKGTNDVLKEDVVGGSEGSIVQEKEKASAEVEHMDDVVSVTGKKSRSLNGVQSSELNLNSSDACVELNDNDNKDSTMTESVCGDSVRNDEENGKGNEDVISDNTKSKNIIADGDSDIPKTKESGSDDVEMRSEKSNVENGFESSKGVKKSDKSEAMNEIYIGSSDEDVEDECNTHIGVAKFSSKKDKYSYCREDDVNGDKFVIANTSDEDDDEDDDVMVQDSSNQWLGGRTKKWKSCLKKDPYPTQEKMHLMLEEAFFLTYGLGCLRILDQDSNPMNISALWQRFLVVQEKFIPHYVAYHYFRSKGWVPKSGLKFGCDFILYREGPPFFHGSYSVVVVPVKEGTLTQMYWENGDLDFSQRWSSWIALAGLNRITEHVSKELMLCYVIFPKGLTEEESKSPKCLPRFKVKEVVVSRWVSSREREAKDQQEDIP